MQEGIIVVIFTMIVLILIYLLLSSIAKPASPTAYFSVFAGLIRSACEQPQYTTNFNFVNQTGNTYPIMFQVYTSGNCPSLLSLHNASFNYDQYYICYSLTSEGPNTIYTINTPDPSATLDGLCAKLGGIISQNAPMYCEPETCGGSNLPLKVANGSTFVYMIQTKLSVVEITDNGSAYVLSYSIPSK